MGKEHQKCHLHYKRELKKTMEENKNPEFQAFAAKLNQILWDSHDPKKGYDPDDDPQARKRKRRNLMRRLAYLMEKDYTDRDSKRFLKRLRREFYHLFSHVISGIDWHNKKAERAVRCFVLLRHMMFGNRTEFDADTYTAWQKFVAKPPPLHGGRHATPQSVRHMAACGSQAPRNLDHAGLIRQRRRIRQGCAQNPLV